jgi:hypothetical protein
VELQGKRALMVGLGKSGLAGALFLPSVVSQSFGSMMISYPTGGATFSVSCAKK